MWKKINFLDYEINQNGEVRSLDRMVKSNSDKIRFAKGRILSQSTTNSG